MESLDGIEANAALAIAPGACAIINSDDPIITQHLNQEAGDRHGAPATAIGLQHHRAPRPSPGSPRTRPRPSGIAEQTGIAGARQDGRRGDLERTIRSRSTPGPSKVFIDGGLAYDRHDPRYQPKSDFELGQPGEGAFQ